MTRLPLRPDLSLWLLAPDADLEQACVDLAALTAPPFWAFCWGAGQALAHYLALHPAVVRGRRVVDLGAGSGVVAIAAARAGASHVTAVDIDVSALEATRHNARLNGVRIHVANSIPEDWDVLLAADVGYETSPRRQLGALASRGTVLVADPVRHPSHALEGTPVLRVLAGTVPEVDPPPRPITVWALRGSELAGT